METEDENTNQSGLLVLGLFIVGHQLIGYGLGVLTRGEIPDWYNSLEKSALTPPDWVFGVTWSFLYLLISISGWLLYQNRHKDNISTAACLFVIQLLLNWSWTFVFFVAHYLLIGAIWIAALIAATISYMYKSYDISRAASLILIPYLLWIGFALYLNMTIWLLN